MELSQPKRYASELMLCDGMNDYHIFHPSVVPGPDDTPYTFQDANEVEVLLERCMNQSVDAEFMLTHFLGKQEISVRNMYSRRDRIQSLTQYILKRPVIITPHIPKDESGGDGNTPADKVSGFFSAYPRQGRQNIDFRFVDAETGKAVSGVRARIIHDDGSFQNLRSSRHGYISREHLTPGTCRLYSDPRDILGLTVDKIVTPGRNGKASRSLFDRDKNIHPPKQSYLCSVREHKVQDHETLSSIAGSCGLSFEDLARFNWGTSNRRKALAAMKRDTGCSRETDAGDDCLFESTNEPGIIFIPEPFEQGGFKTGMEHTIRVWGTGFGAFIESLDIRIVDSNNNPLQHVTCEIKDPGGQVVRKTSDDSGYVRFTGVNAGKSDVTLVDYHHDELTFE